MSSIKVSNSHYLGKKFALISLIALTFLMASFWLNSNIHERGNLLNKAKNDIFLAWSGPQTIIGPMLIVPYTHHQEQELNKKIIKKDVLKYVILLPERLETNTTTTPEIRRRGIFDVLVYQTNIESTCLFIPSSHKADGNKTMHWEQVKIVACIDDVRGFNSVNLSVNNTETLVSSGSAALNNRYPGIHGQFPIKNLSEPLEVKLSMNIKGSETLCVLPIAKSNTINFNAPWPDPSFIGAFLPNTKTITNNNFKAEWQISSLATGLPNHFELTEAVDKNIFSKSIGVKFLKTSDHYQQSERTTKYIFLFMFYTFLVFFLYEVVKEIKIHIFQYFMTACSLLCFSLLLTAFAEHMSFEVAYGLTSVAIIGQIAFYSFGLFHKKIERVLFVCLLVALYTYLFVVLRLEEIAFLIGAIGMFVAISIAMYFTKKINWFEEKKSLPES